MTFIFSGSRRNFFWCYYKKERMQHFLVFARKNAIFYKLFWYKIFVHWKSKWLNFLMDSVIMTFSNFLLTIRNTPQWWAQGDVGRRWVPWVEGPRKWWRVPSLVSTLAAASVLGHHFWRGAHPSHGWVSIWHWCRRHCQLLLICHPVWHKILTC